MSLSVNDNDSHRSGSLRSVASNASIASGVSLTRRPRTPKSRARSRTMTGSPSPRIGTPTESPVLPYFDKPVNVEPEDGTMVPQSSIPVRPPRSPQRATSIEVLVNSTRNPAVDQSDVAVNEVPPVAKSVRLFSLVHCSQLHLIQSCHAVKGSKASFLFTRNYHN